MIRHIIASSFVALLCCLRGGAAQYDACTNGTVADIGNGRCDAANNNPLCGYDGGDCCSCTCAESAVHSCADSDLDCISPDCGDSVTTSEDSTCSETRLGDGVCDDENNNLSCDYDGGDCCACTCDTDGSSSVCGFMGFNCRDPTCFDPAVVAEFPDCTGDWLMVGDGDCQAENNSPSCGYDGGDCCGCSCSGIACAVTSFDCLDPGVDEEFFECKAPPPAAQPCSAGVQRTWVVDDFAKAQALTTAVNCSGGSFEVEWRGSVVVDAPIYVGGGTVLTVVGVGPNTVIDGNSSTRLFTVVNASLHLSDVNVSYGASAAGGAIAAAGSSLTLNQTNFVGNRATGDGGAVYVSGASSVSCTGGTFTNNAAGSNGGAMYVTGGSVVSCGGSWLSNVAGNSAGALMVDGYSGVSWSDDTVFAYNTAERFGGAVDAFNGSIVSWNASTVFYSNSAGLGGGALYIALGSATSWSGTTTFDANNASSDVGIGGAMTIFSGSNASWSGATTYMNNVAGGDGGGVYIYGDSKSTWSGVTTYTNNLARGIGGGAVVAEMSQASCTEETINAFSGNSAAIAGALFIDSNSSVTFRGNSSFDSNSAKETGNGTGFGGAVFVSGTSTAKWTGRSVFTGNTAVEGGALYLNYSTGSWIGAVIMALNIGSEYGGAIQALGSNMSWDGETEMFNNSAGINGGALYAHGSNVRWFGETTISNNSGGAVNVGSCDLSWGGNMTLAHNRNEGALGSVLTSFVSNVVWGGGTTQIIENYSSQSGGALYIYGGNVSWSGDTEFFGNYCGLYGSAIDTHYGANVSWGGGTTRFTQNYAESIGTIMVDDSIVSWSGTTEFVNNTVDYSGAAIFIRDGGHVSWTGDTTFTSNRALRDGGAVATETLDPEQPAESTLVISGPTTFYNNTAGGNGGGLALLGGCALTIDTVDVSFIGNSAQVAGGGIFVSSVNVGPVFTEVSFISNSAAIGGAVSLLGSGNEDNGMYSTTFTRCWFIGNRASSTGGAINTVSGQDRMYSSVFEGNSAGTGGALRLAGAASLYNCSFVENTSNDGEGPAVSNIGYVWWMDNTSFSGNGFDCPSDTFLEYIESGDPFETACQGCETACNGCEFVEGRLAPTCTEVMDHSTSSGGNVTLQELSIQRGYWRATASSTDVFACYHADACLGGVTGSSAYCLDGYEGPYCSICSDGYTAQLSFTCSICSDNRAGGIVVAVVFTVVALFVVVTVASYVTKGDAGLGTARGVIERLTRCIPLQSVKIVIVAWQILTQFASVANVTYPHVYENLLDGLDVFNFDLSWVLSAGCVFDIDFHDQLLVSTISPLMALVFLACTYASAAYINRESPEHLQTVWHKHVSMALLLTFFVYSSVSSTLFKAFACEELDDGKHYLRSDYRIECDSSKHKGFQVYAGFMVVLYTVGIPALYFGLLFRDREVLKKNTADREDSTRITLISDLWKPYKPSAFYYEVVECGRRVLLAGVVVFIYPNTAAQIAVTLSIAFVFVLVSEVLAPFSSRWDSWISRMGHVVVFASMYVALLLKADVSNERASSQKLFEAVLVAVHACMLLVVVVEAVVISYSLKAGQREVSPPGFCCGQWLTKKLQTKRRRVFTRSTHV